VIASVIEALAIPFGFLARRERAVSDPIGDEPRSPLGEVDSKGLPVE